jgi:hypothetical protein
MDARVVKIDLRGVYRALVEIHDPLVLLHGRLGRGGLLLRDGVLGEGLLVALEVDPGVFQERLVASELALGLREGGGVGARIDDREDVAFLHDLALRVVDLREFADDAAGHSDRVHGRHGPDRVEVDVELARLRLGLGNRDSGAPAGVGAGGGPAAPA